MHHTSARVAITQLLAGNGFGERGLALVTAASLGDADQSAVRLRAAALERATALPCDSTTSYTGALLYAPIPGDERELCQQLCPALIDQPGDVGLQLASLAALVALWPHVSSDERALLRSKFLDGLVSQQMPSGASLSSAQLCSWQRDLPTAFSETKASVASLKCMLAETQAKSAYRVLAEHLGINADLATLSWVLGALSVQLRLQYHDHDRRLLHVLLGTVACEWLATWAAPEHLLAMISQLSHQLWWCKHHANLTPVRTCLDPAPRPFAEAVASGDLTVAQRAARAAAKQPGEFWDTVWTLLGGRIAQNDPNWSQALAVAVAIAWRTSGDVISPDDAAALGTVFADLAYREKTLPELAAN